MSLKKCPFCAEEILEEAVKCKHCGEHLNPIGRQSAAPTTIEQTGKVWKLLEICGVLLVLITSGFLLYGYGEWGLLFGLPGLGLFFCGRIGGWWHHG